MSNFLDTLGTILSEFQIGLPGAGLRRLKFRNQFSGNLEWNPTADRTVSLPDKSGTIALLDDVGASSEVGARVYHNTNQSIASGTTPIALEFNSERYDTNGQHVLTSPDNKMLVCQVAGTYLIGGSISYGANSTGSRSILVFLNGSIVIAHLRIPTNASGFTHLAIATAYPLVVNDFVELRALQDSGSSINVVASGNTSPEFYIQKI